MNLEYVFLKFKKKLFPNIFKSKDFVRMLQIKEIRIGANTYFFGTNSTIVDTQRPELLEIGDYCKIASGVKILTHDYSRSVLRKKYGEVLGEAKKTIIQDNVFIGIDSIILPGTVIGNNVIVGAGSVVRGKIPDDVVVAGNPAKVIESLDEYYKKRKSRYIDEAREYAKCLMERKKKPTIERMGEFFPIYLPRDTQKLKYYKIKTDLSGDDEKDIIEKFLNSEPIYDSFEEFLKTITNNKEGKNEQSN